MEVTLEPHIGVGCGSKKPVKLNQYRVRVDGQHAGFVGWDSGAPVLLTSKFTPMELTEIENQVAFIKRDLNVGKASCAPDIPPELQANNEDIEALEDDLE